MIQGISEFLSNPLFWKIVITYYIFNAAASSLPAPNGNKLYQFAYRFIHALAGNLDRLAIAVKVPGAAPVDPKSGNTP